MSYEFSKTERRWYIIALILLALATGFYVVTYEPEQELPSSYGNCVEYPPSGILCLKARGYI